MRTELAAIRSRETCTGCGSPKQSAILAVIGGAAACCPECSTLTVDERNSIRARLAAAEAPKTCSGCVYFRPKSPSDPGCFKVDISIHAPDDFYCCLYAPKASA